MMVETIIEIIQWPVLSIRVYRFKISRNFTAGPRCWLIHQHVTKRAAWIVMIRLSTKPSHDFEQDGGSYYAKASLGDAVHKWRMGTWRTWWQTIWSKAHPQHHIWTKPFNKHHVRNLRYVDPRSARFDHSHNGLPMVTRVSSDDGMGYHILSEVYPPINQRKLGKFHHVKIMSKGNQPRISVLFLVCPVGGIVSVDFVNPFPNTAGDATIKTITYY